MKLTDYNNATGQVNRMMLFIGDPKTGKTRVACGYPKPWVLDTNRNLHSVAEFAPKGLQLECDAPDRKADGSEVAYEDRWELAMAQLTRAVVNPAFETIVVDDFGFLCKLLEGRLLHLAKLETPKTTCLRIQDYGTFSSTLYTLLLNLKKYPKRFVFTCHQHIDKSDTGVFRYELSIPTKAAQTVAGLFTDVIGFATVVDASGPKYRMFTRPSGFHASLGTAKDLKPVIDITNLDPVSAAKALGI